MDQFNTTPSNEAPTQDPPEEKTGSNTGALVGTLIIVVLVAIAAFYFWGARLNERSDNPPSYQSGEESAGSNDTQAGLPPQTSSDSADDIYADIEAMNIQQMEAANANSSQSFEASAQ